MEKSENIKELATALSKAQGEIESAKKDVTNTFFKSKYADLASVVEAIRVPLAKHGLSYIQMSHDHDNAASIETIIMHSSGEWVSTGKTTVPVSKVDAQGFGSAMTYARRYSLSAAFGVAPEEDDGNAAAKAKPESAKSVPQATLETLEKQVQGSAEFLQGIAADTVALLDEDRTWEAKCFIEGKRLDADEKTALWALFNSKQRSALKAAVSPQEFANTP